MQYTISAQINFTDFKQANLVFEYLKTLQAKYSNINSGMDNNEDTFIRLIQNDHDLPIEKRTGSILLATIDTAKIQVLEPVKITNLLK